jgi:hypothetical protein
MEQVGDDGMGARRKAKWRRMKGGENVVIRTKD